MAITVLIPILVLSLLSIFLYGLGPALLPLAVSFIMAYFLFPIVQRLEKWGLNRAIGTLLVFGAALGILIFILIISINPLIDQVQSFIQEWPKQSSLILTKVETFLNSYGLALELKSFQQIITELFQNFSKSISLSMIQNVTSFLQAKFAKITNIFIIILNFFLFPVFFFYVVKDFEKYGEELKALLPHHLRSPIKEFYLKVNLIFKSYFRGQFIVAFSLAIFYGIGLHFTSLKFGLLIGIMTGLLSIIPYVGFTLGLVSALVFSLSNFPGLLPFLLILLVFNLGQVLEGFILTPKLVGENLGLNPLITMLALIVGGNFGGFLGMIFALPLVASLKILIEIFLDMYQKSDYYLGKNIS